MTPSDVINPFLFLGLLVGSAPPAIILLAFHSAGDHLNLDQSQDNHQIRIKRNSDISSGVGGNNEESKFLSGFQQDLSPPISQGLDRLEKQLQEGKPKNLPNFDHRSTLDWTENSREIGWSLRHLDLDLRHELYAGVFSSGVRTQEALTAVMMTWGSAVSQVDLYYPSGTQPQKNGKSGQIHRWIPFKEDRIADPIMRTLHSMCSTAGDNFNWYLVTSESTYVNTDQLLSRLQQMSPSESIVIADDSGNGQCDPRHAIVLSSSAFRGFCSRIDTCLLGENAMDTLSCLEETVGITCSTIKQVVVNHRLSPIFETNMSSPELLLSYHLEVMDQRIAHAKEKMAALHRLISTPPATSSSYMEASDVILSQVSVMLKNRVDFSNESHPSHNSIGRDGIEINQLCQFSHQKQVLETGYAEAKQLSDAIYRKTENKTLPSMFGFSYVGNDIEKAFEFYYIEHDSKGTDKVTQINIGQEFGSFEVVDSQVQYPQAITVITTINYASPLQIDKFLSMVHQACRGVVSSQMTCERTLLMTDRSSQQLQLNERYLNRMGARVEFLDHAKPFPDLQTAGIPPGLVVVVPIRSHFSEEFIKRCAINTKVNESAYFPIPFKSKEMYLSASSDSPNKQINVIWETSNFDIFCMDSENLRSQSFAESPEVVYQHLIGRDDFAVSRFVDPGITVFEQ